jgi:phage terminase large subunit
VRFLNDWCWTFDPRLKKAKTIPFRLFPRQVEFVRWMQEREENEEDGLVEKSRDAGATWVACGYVVHAWLFRKGFSAGFGSRKQNLVDQIGNPDSIFEKMRILLRNLPRWMLPENFNWGKHDNFCKLLNPQNGSSITGEAGDNIGRGGRQSIYFIDESAHIARAQKVDAALSATTRCRIDISTPCGPGNSFAKKRFSGLIAVFQFHWRQDPRKDDAWYENEKRRLDSVTLAQEVDIDYNASIEGLAIPAKWVQAAIGFAAWLKEHKGLEMPRNGPRKAGLDISDEGKDRSVLVSGVGYVIDKIESWGQLNTTQTANKAANFARAWKVAVLNYDGVGIGAGVKGTWNSAETPLGFESHPINVGLPGSSRKWPSGRTGAELFSNLKAELWWSMRVRFEKTFEKRASITPSNC